MISPYSRARGKVTTIGVIVAMVCLVLVTALVPPAGAGTSAEEVDSSTSPSLVVTLFENGSATITLTLTYDLENNETRAAFRDLQSDENTRERLRSRFGGRMAELARETEADREMTTGTATIDVWQVNDSTGAVELSVMWHGLAARTTDGGLAVSEPFASGFDPDRRFVVVAPEGYAVEVVRPPPNASTDRRVVYEPERRLSGFELVVVPEDNEDTETTENGGTQADETTTTEDQSGDGSQTETPGFGVGIAVVAVVLAVVARVKR